MEKNFKIFFILFCGFFITQNISSLCEEGQIDINSASAEELDEIIWVGPATAEKIINARPFESVDSLINVSGIGDIKLADIKEQGLACVNEETEEEEPVDTSDTEEVNEEVKEDIEAEEIEEDVKQKDDEENNIEKVEQKAIVLETIKLEPKDIKSKSNSENLSKNNYAMYGFVIFCILLGFLFILKKNNFNKNEFR